MMTNQERCILQYLLNQLYDYRIFPEAMIALDVPQWMSIFAGLGPSDLHPQEKMEAYHEVLRLAKKHFGSDKDFSLHFIPETYPSVYLKYQPSKITPHPTLQRCKTASNLSQLSSGDESQ